MQGRLSKLSSPGAPTRRSDRLTNRDVPTRRSPEAGKTESPKAKRRYTSAQQRHTQGTCNPTCATGPRAEAMRWTNTKTMRRGGNGCEVQGLRGAGRATEAAA